MGTALLDKKYRPVSNFSFISKIIEKCVAEQLVDHIDSNGLNEIMQSAYKKHHSTETALLKVKSDILQILRMAMSPVLSYLTISCLQHGQSPDLTAKVTTQVWN